MVVSSTYADIYNAITAGIDALAGHWHGGTNQDVMETLIDLDESGEGPIEWTKSAIEEGRRIPGFGHCVYDVEDPRAKILEAFSQELGERGIAPTVDFYFGSVYYQLAIPIDLYTSIFAISRVAGWVGHILEY